LNVLIATVGSRGDVQPMLVLAEALLRRGHRVRIAAPPNFKGMVEACGVRFVALGSDTEQIIRQNQSLAEASPVVAVPRQLSLMRSETERQVRDLLAERDRDRERVDVVVAAGLAFGAYSLAERVGASYVYVSYSLSGIRDDAHPPGPMPVFGLPRTANRCLWRLIELGFDWAMRGPIDAARTAHGLDADPEPFRHVYAERVLLAQDAVFGTPSESARAFCEQVPALVRREPGAALPADVERFLLRRAGRDGRADRVAYVGFGSMPTVERARIVRAVIELWRATGTRMLLYSAYGEDAERELPEGVLAIRSLDHTRLFPRLDWIVHHGGAGTTATALRAGVPQLIVPHIIDQFFHGHRIAELGVGPAPIRKAKLDAEALIAASRSAVECAGRAREIGDQLRDTSGAEAAVGYLERLRLARLG
jgi:UDP:flavonoid glycosyltransferase YjiC (YdhE family)